MLPRFFNKKTCLLTAIAVGTIASKSARFFKHKTLQVSEPEEPFPLGKYYPPALQHDAQSAKTHRRPR